MKIARLKGPRSVMGSPCGIALIDHRRIEAACARRVPFEMPRVDFDAANRALLRDDRGLRLRTNRNVETGEVEHVVTYKGPRQPGAMKSREELEVKVSEPLLLKFAISSTPAAESAVLRLSIEFTLPAPATLLRVSVVVPAAVLKTSVSPCSEFVPPLVKSVAVPGTAAAPAPVGAAMETLAFVR